MDVLVGVDEGEDGAFGSATDGAGEVGVGGGEGASGEDEGALWGEGGVEGVDGALEGEDVVGGYCGGGALGGGEEGGFADGDGGGGEVGAEVEECGLDGGEEGLGGGVLHLVDVGSKDAEVGVEFVEVAVGGYAGGVFGDACAADE